MSQKQIRIAVIGGGIIGLATAYKLLLKHPHLQLDLFEKEAGPGKHQSGRNSGVLHCGLYYQPGSLKAKLAVEGIREMTNFCQEHAITHEICGKVVVASNQQQDETLRGLAKRGEANGLQGLKFLNNAELKSREPMVRATSTLLVPEEGIVDYKAVMNKLVELIQELGGRVHFRSSVWQIKETKTAELVVVTQTESYTFDRLVSCTGLHSDRTFSNYTGKKRPLRIVPFRGEYLSFKPEFEYMVNHLVYPVPDVNYPFLGVHFTRMVSGEREVGPNAVLAFKREGYTNKDFNFKDAIESLTYVGFLNFLRKNFNFAMGEFASSLLMSSFITKAKIMIPEVEASMLVKGTAGVRAQAMDPSGKLLMDFNIEREGNQVHVLNAPSPGATSSLAIASYILDNYLTDLN
ncbi:MAG TPA: L-2-hydroxyglutarate oxidase [Daejeonella sp.]|nr:L-2-hydroxyglutarate oxidase [Daejeonella sp.]